ncbi:ABC transporter ATP-binding protein [Microbacterium sp. Kw_RZR3]|jgi:putative ABC transport system ATP-binding protein|uniref:ABC transporter ATP-binding protein n=1 Tax=unclassified Microbacterium TaxID=2609290 RepID=UPI0023D978F1|nr:ABC transporter ATP-binding protein [Microbacterium sp. Kw_RZR3]MDF2047544.1 ABC transporter ATP-binding protein [Microbacterium sp. Kw_RZR3]
MTAVLELRGATRVHGQGAREVTALRHADLIVRPREFVAVMGPSGSGKSTLLHLAGGLDRPTSGQVLLEGTDIGGLDATKLALLRRRSVGYVFQDFNLLPSLTAAENVAFPLELDGHSARRARRAALDVLADTGLIDVADRRPDELSGGQAQRVAIARALVGARRLVLADEPTGALDSATGTAVLEVLRDRADRGAAVLMVTHEPRFAAWADRTIFLRDGRIVDQTGPSDPDALLAEASGVV